MSKVENRLNRKKRISGKGKSQSRSALSDLLFESGESGISTFIPTKEQVREMDEEAANQFASFSKPLSGKILWNDYDEVEIQGILKLHFEHLGYEVRWAHVHDPSHEGGIDLECESKDGGRRIIVAVKKKPAKDDLGQVVELSDQRADRRFYIYINGAAQSFQDKMQRFSNVEFWNENRLQSELDKTGLLMELRVANSSANDAMLRIMVNIGQTVKPKKSYTKPPKPFADLMETIWTMKDRAVTLLKCCRMIQLMLEEKTVFGREMKRDVAETFTLRCLEYLYSTSLLSLKNSFDYMTPEFKSLLGYVNRKTNGRSNWSYLYGYVVGLKPGFVLSELKKREEFRIKTDDSEAADEKRTKKEAVTLLELSDQEIASDLFRRLSIWALGLEDTIDYLHEYAVRGYVSG